MSLQLSLKPSNRLAFGLTLVATAVTGTTVLYATSLFGRVAETPKPAVTVPTVTRITALGRLQPETEVIRVSAPLTLVKDRIAQLLVQRGERVKAGQVIAILDSRDRLESGLKEAQEKVRVAQARLAQVKAGAKTGEIEAQRATIIRQEAQLEGEKAAQQATINRLEAQLQGDKAVQKATISRLEAQLEGDKAAQKATIQKLEAEVKNAESEYNRYQKLHSEGATSESSFDSKRLNWDTTRQQLNEAKVTLERIERTGDQHINEARVTLERIERTGQQQLNEARVSLKRIESTGRQQISEAKSTLDRIAEVRTVDVQAAQTEVDTVQAAVKKAETELNQVYVRAPIDGRILEIHSQAGETISDKGIVELGQTDQMEVVAEIYQTDISKIREGQQAVIIGESFSGEVRGTVRLIGLQVSQQNVYSNQPGQNLDRKVIEVRISVNPEDTEKVAGLTHSQVQVAVQL